MAAAVTMAAAVFLVNFQQHGRSRVQQACATLEEAQRLLVSLYNAGRSSPFSPQLDASMLHSTSDGTWAFHFDGYGCSIRRFEIATDDALKAAETKAAAQKAWLALNDGTVHLPTALRIEFDAVFAAHNGDAASLSAWFHAPQGPKERLLAASRRAEAEVEHFVRKGIAAGVVDADGALMTADHLRRVGRGSTASFTDVGVEAAASMYTNALQLKYGGDSKAAEAADAAAEAAVDAADTAMVEAVTAPAKPDAWAQDGQVVAARYALAMAAEQRGVAEPAAKRSKRTADADLCTAELLQLLVAARSESEMWRNGQIAAARERDAAYAAVRM